MQLSKMWILAAALVPLMPFSLHAEEDSSQEYGLRYRFQPGQVVRFEVVSREDYTIRIGEAEESPYSHQTSQKHLRVISVESDGTAIVDLTFDWIEAEIFQNEEKFTFDSRTSEGSAPIFENFRQLVGHPHLRAKISPSGQASDVQLLVQQEGGTEKPQLTNPEILPELPETAKKVGESWTQSYEVSILIPNSVLRRPVRMQRRYTLNSVEGDVATISARTSILTVIDDPDEQVQLIRRCPVEVIQLDIKKGVLISRRETLQKEVVGFGEVPASSIKITSENTQTVVK